MTTHPAPDALRLMPEHATDAALSLAPVLRSRGRKNSLHDIKRAANLLELLALDVSRHDAAPAVQPAAGEPVAWRWRPRRNTSATWSFGSDPIEGDVGVPNSFYEVRPLYAHPPAQASESGGDEYSDDAIRAAILVSAESALPDDPIDRALHLNAIEKAKRGELDKDAEARAIKSARAFLAALSAPQAAPGEGEQS